MAIVLVAATAIGRFSVVGVREARLAAPAAPKAPADAAAPKAPADAAEPAGPSGWRRIVTRRKVTTDETAEPATEPVGSSSS